MRRPWARRLVPSGCPLVETHVHFEGSIPPRVLARLAARAGRPLPARWLREGGPLQRGRGFQAFVDAFIFCGSLLRESRWIEEAASALFGDLRAEGVAWAEVTVSPQIYLRRGVSFGEVIAGLAAARERARREGGPEVRFIVDGGRALGGAWFEEIVDQAALYKREGVTAVGLGGEEGEAPARAFRRAFERARGAGLRTVVHAGEGTTPRAVREAIEDLGADRIAHGIAAASSPSLLRVISRRGLTLDICPTSNVLTRAVASFRRHPLPAILQAGVRAALGTDDRTIFGTDLRTEYIRAVEAVGIRSDQVPVLLLHGVEGSFAPERIKKDLAARIRAAFAGREEGFGPRRPGR